VGRLELPLPELGASLDESAIQMQDMIRAHVPEAHRSSVAVRAFRREGKTGLEISYDDAIESLVYAALEYPKNTGRDEGMGP